MYKAANPDPKQHVALLHPVVVLLSSATGKETLGAGL
jgi:hypothetical protein